MMNKKFNMMMVVDETRSGKNWMVEIFKVSNNIPVFQGSMFVKCYDDEDGEQLDKRILNRIIRMDDYSDCMNALTVLMDEVNVYCIEKLITYKDGNDYHDYRFTPKTYK